MWEKEKLLVQAISPFPTMFSKGFFPKGVKRCHCVRMGEVLHCDHGIYCFFFINSVLNFDKVLNSSSKISNLSFPFPLIPDHKYTGHHKTAITGKDERCVSFNVDHGGSNGEGCEGDQPDSWLNGVLRHFQQYFSHITAIILTVW